MVGLGSRRVVVCACLATMTAVETAPAAAACRVVEGGRILGRDLAEAHPLFRALDGDLSIAYAPAPGTQRVLTAGYLRLLALSHALQPDQGELHDICFQRLQAPLTRSQVLEALEAALAAAQAPAGTEWELMDWSRQNVPAGKLEFPRAGLVGGSRPPDPGALLWRGVVRYEERKNFPVWARVKLSLRRARVVAKTELPAGRPIAADQVAVEEKSEFPFAETPFAEADRIAGSLPRRTIPRGGSIHAGMLNTPREIARGDLVAVEVASGQARLRFEALAESAGRAGDRILVKNPANGRRFPARVLARGKVVVETNRNQGAPE